jgi:hypothetical protein
LFDLAVSQNQIRLLEGTRDRLEEVHLPGVPVGVRDALQGEPVQKHLQLYVADRGGVGARGVFHGHGSADDLQKEQVLRYFRKVNRALREVLAAERAPMVLAAVDHLAPLWRQVNSNARQGRHRVRAACRRGAGGWERRGRLPVLGAVPRNQID